MSQDNFTFLQKYFEQHDNITLKRGDKSAAQQAATHGLQQFLQEQGVDTGAVDGLYGKKTEAAVKAFQEKYNLKVSGTVDEKTFDKMNALRHQQKLEHIERVVPLKELELENQLDALRVGVLKEVVREVNGRDQSRPAQNLGDVFHNLGVSMGLNEFRISPGMEEQLERTNKVVINGQSITLSEKELRDPEALKTQMQKLASVISGGEESQGQFDKTAEILAASADIGAEKIRGK